MKRSCLRILSHTKLMCCEPGRPALRTACCHSHPFIQTPDPSTSAEQWRQKTESISAQTKLRDALSDDRCSNPRPFFSDRTTPLDPDRTRVHDKWTCCNSVRAAGGSTSRSRPARAFRNQRRILIHLCPPRSCPRPKFGIPPWKTSHQGVNPRTRPRRIAQRSGVGAAVPAARARKLPARRRNPPSDGGFQAHFARGTRASTPQGSCVTFLLCGLCVRHSVVKMHGP